MEVRGTPREDQSLKVLSLNPTRLNLICRNRNHLVGPFSKKLRPPPSPCLYRYPILTLDSVTRSCIMTSPYWCTSHVHKHPHLPLSQFNKNLAPNWWQPKRDTVLVHRISIDWLYLVVLPLPRLRRRNWILIQSHNLKKGGRNSSTTIFVGSIKETKCKESQWSILHSRLKGNWVRKGINRVIHVLQM